MVLAKGVAPSFYSLKTRRPILLDDTAITVVSQSRYRFTTNPSIQKARYHIFALRCLLLLGYTHIKIEIGVDGRIFTYTVSV